MHALRSSMILAAVAVGCGSGSREEADPLLPTSIGADDDGGDGIGDDAEPADDEDDDGEDDDGPILDVGAGDPDASACACAPKSDLVYLLAWDGLSAGSLWTFDPATLAFEDLGPIPCQAGADSVFSMGVGRDARAWIEYAPSGDLLTFDVNSGQCIDPNYQPGQHGFAQFGLAFVSESESDPCDDLYAIRRVGTLPTECPGSACGSLGVIDPASAQLQIINGVPYDGGELTGTGDGRLFAFVGVAPAKLVELDKDSGAIVDVVELTGLELTDAFAFAFWGGDFWFFTEATDAVPGLPEGTSRVVHLDYDGSDGPPALTTVVANAPILVAGAGVSTCAPFTPVG